MLKQVIAIRRRVKMAVCAMWRRQVDGHVAVKQATVGAPALVGDTCVL